MKGGESDVQMQAYVRVQGQVLQPAEMALRRPVVHGVPLQGVRTLQQTGEKGRKEDAGNGIAGHSRTSAQVLRGQAGKPTGVKTRWK